MFKYDCRELTFVGGMELAGEEKFAIKFHAISKILMQEILKNVSSKRKI